MALVRRGDQGIGRQVPGAAPTRLRGESGLAEHRHLRPAGHAAENSAPVRCGDLVRYRIQADRFRQWHMDRPPRGRVPGAALGAFAGAAHGAPRRGRRRGHGRRGRRGRGRWNPDCGAREFEGRGRHRPRLQFRHDVHGRRAEVAVLRVGEPVLRPALPEALGGHRRRAGEHRVHKEQRLLLLRDDAHAPMSCAVWCSTRSSA
mmetsp:Transcript_130719/g.419204  ORF Transcript_130719/g.419204 Transcript_130719/m.419204 type:complete len:203 (+) Transcript_130719:1643-2251(+)